MGEITEIDEARPLPKRSEASLAKQGNNFVPEAKHKLYRQALRAFCAEEYRHCFEICQRLDSISSCLQFQRLKAEAKKRSINEPKNAFVWINAETIPRAIEWRDRNEKAKQN